MCVLIRSDKNSGFIFSNDVMQCIIRHYTYQHISVTQIANRFKKTGCFFSKNDKF